jgi:hypothetical protein
VLDHCRDPRWVHLRGCWVLDAILDGDWTELHKTATTTARKKTKEKKKK